jgi:sporulation protein YlmC with PRC-barrel domain
MDMESHRPIWAVDRWEPARPEWRFPNLTATKLRSEAMQETQTSDFETAGTTIPASRVNGTAVYNANGEHLGHIEDIILNKQSGLAEYAVMSFGGFLGIGERYHPLPWRSLRYEETEGGYVVNVSRDQLERGPTYGVDEEPDWNDREFKEGIYAHYGYPMI